MSALYPCTVSYTLHVPAPKHACDVATFDYDGIRDADGFHMFRQRGHHDTYSAPTAVAALDCIGIALQQIVATNGLLNISVWPNVDVRLVRDMLTMKQRPLPANDNGKHRAA